MIRFESRPCDNSVSLTLGSTCFIAIKPNKHPRSWGGGELTQARSRKENGGGGWAGGRRLKAKGAREGVIREVGGKTMYKGGALGGAPKTTAGSILDSAGFLAPD